MTRAMAGGVAAVVALAVAVAVWVMGDVPPDGDPNVAAPLIAAPATDATVPMAETPVAVPMQAPTFDVVRVDAGGLATIAGSAQPGGRVSLRLDGAELVQFTADAGGAFATVLTLTPSDVPRMLSLALILPDGSEVAGRETVALAPVVLPVAVATDATADQPAAAVPQALLIAPEGVTVLQTPVVEVPDKAPELAPELAPEFAGVEAAEPAVLASQIRPLTIDSIAYGIAGEVLVGGRSAPEAVLRLYLDEVPVADLTADARGGWQARLAEAAEGLHVLRADQIDANGKVVTRFETPFKRELPLTVVAEAAPIVAGSPEAQAAPMADAVPSSAAAPITITVQPGLTLWAIARENFGEGVMYVQVFEANRDKIKNPDLIYPGQVFTVPKP